MNGVIISLIINLLVSFSIFGLDLPAEIKTIIFFIMSAFWLTSLAGSIIYFLTKNKSFALLGIIGFAVFMPIGLIGAVSLRNIVNEEEKKEFLEKIKE